MLKTLMERNRDEKGFTLIELMVVVLIIAILIAIAIPTFLGARKRAQDRAAQSNLRNGLTAAKTIFTDKESYEDADATELAKSEPSLKFDGPATNVNSTDAPNHVGVGAEVDGAADPDSASCTSNCSAWYAAAYSKSGLCFAIRDVAGPTTATSGLGTTFAKKDVGTGACDVQQFATGDFSQKGWE